jgi:hypothetical protein
MKTKKSTLRMETLEDRNMLSASPLGSVAAPTQTASTHSSGGAAGGIVSEGQGYGVFQVAETETSTTDDKHKRQIEIESWSLGADETATAAGKGVWKSLDGGQGLTVKMKETLVSGAQDDGSDESSAGTGDADLYTRLGSRPAQADPQDGSAHAIDAVFTGVGGDELSLHVRLPPPRN